MSNNLDNSDQRPDKANDFWREVGTGLLFAIFMPFFVARRLVDLAAHRPLAWRRHSWRGVPPRLLLLGSAIIGVLAGLLLLPVLAAMLWPLGLNSLAAVLLWWCCLTPAAVTIAAIVALPAHARAVAEGRSNPASVGTIRQAIKTAADIDAYARCGWALGRSGLPVLAANQDPIPETVEKDGRSIPVLGVLVDAERRDPLTAWLRPNQSRGTRSQWTADDRFLVLPAKPPRAVLLGGSGTGKTVAILSLVEAALREQWQVLVIDCKGAAADIEKFTATARRAGISATQVRVWPHKPWRLWVGSADSVVSVGMALLPNDGAQVYRARARAALTAIATPGPWRSTEELLARLSQPAKFVTDRQALRDLTSRVDARTTLAEATRLGMSAATAGLFTSPDGFGFGGDWSLGVVSAPAGSAGAEEMVRAILADLNVYRTDVTRRSPLDPPLLVILDEAATVLDDPRTPPVAAIAEQGRSLNIGIVVAAQSYEGLGKSRARLFGSGATLMTAAISDPTAIVDAAGSVSAPEHGHQTDEYGQLLTGRTAVREQRQFAIDPDEIRRLGVWRWVVHEPGSGTLHALIPPRDAWMVD